MQDLSSPQYAALAWMANSDSADLQLTMSDDELVERFVLVLLYFATGGASWSDQVRFLTPSLNTCSWNSIVDGTTIGIGCNEEGSVVRFDVGKFPNLSNLLFMNFANELILTLIVSTVDLESNGISGSVPTEIGLLSDLVYIRLARNQFTGSVPSQLGQLSSLNFLQISGLINLGLNSNSLTGTIPRELGQISTLERLSLSDNALTGTIPSELGQISTLNELYLAGNALTGTLPTELGQVQHLWFP